MALPCCASSSVAAAPVSRLCARFTIAATISRSRNSSAPVPARTFSRRCRCVLKTDPAPRECVGGLPVTPCAKRHTVGPLRACRRGGAADKAANLAGWKSPCRQLPVFRRQAYPMHAEVTKHVLLGRKNLSCPAAVCAGVGTIWEVSKLGGLNIKKCLQPRKYAPRKIVFAGRSGEADPHPCWGRPMTRRKKQV